MYYVMSCIYLCCVMICVICGCFFFFKQKTAYEMRISDWSSDVCSSDLSLQRALSPSTPATLYNEPTKPRESFDLDGVKFVGMEIGRASCRERVCQYV